MSDLYHYLEEGTAIYLKGAVDYQGTVVMRGDEEVLIEMDTPDELVGWRGWYHIDEVELADDD